MKTGFDMVSFDMVAFNLVTCPCEKGIRCSICTSFCVCPWCVHCASAVVIKMDWKSFVSEIDMILCSESFFCISVFM